MSAKGQIYDNASQLERLYHITHIPYRYWKADVSKVTFSSMTYAPTGESKLRLSAAAQEAYYQKLIDCMREGNTRKNAGSFVCISSDPSEEDAMTAGFGLVRELIAARPSANIGVVDLSLFRPIDRSIPYDLVIIHNMTAESNRNRIQDTRDYIEWATRSALCILCCSGKTSLEMCYEVLRMPANMALYSDERSTRRTLNF